MSGLAERNAAQPLGDFRFIFAGDNGCARYPGGVIEMVYVTVELWGAYEHCQKTPKGTHLCGGGREYAGCDGQAGPGKEWFSFPASGQNKHWWEECGRVRKGTHEVYSAMCKAGGCKCDGGSGCPAISACVNGMPDDKKVKAWLGIFGVHMTDDEAALYNTTSYWDLPVHNTEAERDITDEFDDDEEELVPGTPGHEDDEDDADDDEDDDDDTDNEVEDNAAAAAQEVVSV